MTRRRKKETEAELDAKWTAAVKGAARNIFIKTAGGPPAPAAEWKETFTDDLGIKYIITRYPPEADAPAVYGVTFQVWLGVRHRQTPEQAEAARAREAAGSRGARLILRELEQADAAKRRRETNTNNALKKQEETHDQIRERWRQAREKGMTYHKFRTTQDVSARTVDRAVPPEERH